MNEAKALLAIARAQKALVTLTAQNLRRDQLDGLRAAGETKKHSDFYFEIRNKWLSQGLIDSTDARTADTTAGFKNI